MYVTQAAQFSKYTEPSATPVALVANRQAEVRVFVVSAPTSSPLAQRPVVRILVGGQELADVSPPSPNPFPSGLSRSLTKTDELAVSHSYNALIPPAMMAAGTLPVQAIILGTGGNATSAQKRSTSAC